MTFEESVAYEALATRYGDFEDALLAKYNVHFCSADDIAAGACTNAQCSFAYDEAPTDALRKPGCVSAADAAEYQRLQQDVENMGIMLEQKYLGF